MKKVIWLEDELNYLVNNYSRLTINELMITLNKTRKQILYQLKKMELQYFTEK